MTVIKAVPTFTATIYVGRRVRETGQIIQEDFARAWLRSYCDRVGLCVTLTPTTFVYADGLEPGFAVGLINYPRFPSTPKIIAEHAIEIAKELKILFCQMKVSVVFPTETVMIGEDA